MLNMASLSTILCKLLLLNLVLENKTEMPTGFALAPINYRKIIAPFINDQKSVIKLSNPVIPDTCKPCSYCLLGFGVNHKCHSYINGTKRATTTAPGS